MAYRPGMVHVSVVLQLVFMLYIKASYYDSFTTGITAVKTAFTGLNATMMANPIGIVLAAIAALVTAFTMLWNTSDSFRSFG